MSDTSAPRQRPADGGARGVGGAGALNVLGAVCQQGCLLAITMIIARVLGQADLGVYVLCYAMLTLLSLAAVFGFRPVLIRYIAMYLADDAPGHVRGTLRFAAGVSGLTSTVMAVVLLVLVGPIAEVFGIAGDRYALVFVALTVPAFTLRDLALAATQGWRTQLPFALIGWILEPVTRLGLTVGALGLGWGLRGAFVALLAAAWISAGASWWALARRLRTLSTAPRALDVRPVLSFAVASFANVAAATGIVWADTLILGALADPSAVGLYVVGTRLVGLAIFVMPPLDALFAPHFAHLYHTQDRARLEQTYTVATTWILRLSAPAFAALLVFPERLLAVFGREFEAAATVTLLLAVGQLVNAATGPCGSLLVMAGRVRVNLLTNGLGLVLNIVLNVALIPPLGIVGAAIAWSSSLMLLNLAKLVAVQRILGLTPFGSGTVRVLAAATAAVTAAVIGDLFAPTGLPWTLVLCLVVGGVYLAASWLLGLGADERQVLTGTEGLSSLGGRFGRSRTRSSTSEGSSSITKST